MNTISKKIGYFPAPSVPSADPTDGLIRTADLNNLIRVEFKAWEGIRPGYTAQLMIGDSFAARTWTMTPDISVGDTISIDMDPNVLNKEGVYSLYYITENPNSLIRTNSKATSLIVDLTAPGACLLAPVIVANVSFGEYFKARVPSYAGMEPGDVIQTVCNGAQGPAYRVLPKNLTTNPVEISFSKEFLEGLFSDRINITYHVTDRAGNRSILAQSVELTMQH
ncbi:hypothetical protein [Pseudomonas caspiana]|uniref:hypothetical protein n=1 Tax=Pseudomonas caspiana TaxID=1451454 RepID=UPI0032EACC33